MGKRLSQLNEVEQVSRTDYLLVDGEEYLESKKILIKNIDIKDFNTKSLDKDLEGKQEVLIDGKNIKKINGQSILGEGEIQIQGGGSIDPEVLKGKQDKFADITERDGILALIAGRKLLLEGEGLSSLKLLYGMAELASYGTVAVKSNNDDVKLSGYKTEEDRANVNVDGCRIRNLADPIFNKDAVNKIYFDTAIGNIETALDSIIALQNSIIEGDV